MQKSRLQGAVCFCLNVEPKEVKMINVWIVAVQVGDKSPTLIMDEFLSKGLPDGKIPAVDGIEIPVWEPEILYFYDDLGHELATTVNKQKYQPWTHLGPYVSAGLPITEQQERELQRLIASWPGVGISLKNETAHKTWPEK